MPLNVVSSFQISRCHWHQNLPHWEQVLGPRLRHSEKALARQHILQLTGTQAQPLPGGRCGGSESRSVRARHVLLPQRETSRDNLYRRVRAGHSRRVVLSPQDADSEVPLFPSLQSHTHTPPGRLGGYAAVVEGQVTVYHCSHEQGATYIHQDKHCRYTVVFRVAAHISLSVMCIYTSTEVQTLSAGWK